VYAGGFVGDIIFGGLGLFFALLNSLVIVARMMQDR
jgi:hypothetical protein